MGQCRGVFALCKATLGVNMAVIVNISLDPEHDRDILKWLGRQSNRSQAVREAIRSYMAKSEGATLEDVLAELRALPSRLNVVTVTNAETIATEGSEPETAAANLDGLLDRLGKGDLG